MNFKAKKKDCQLVVRAKTTYGEIIDGKELDRFSRVYLRGFLHPKLIKRNVLEYTGPVGISLFERLKKPITKRDFLFIIEQIVVTMQKLYANNFPVINLIMDTRYVYINETTKEIQFLYVPSSFNKDRPNLIQFVESIVYSAKPNDEKDNDFVSRFIYFFRAIVPFDINRVEEFVAIEDRSVVNTIKKQNAGQSGFMTNDYKHYHEYYDKKRAVDDDESTGLLDDSDDATGLLADDAVEISPEDESTGLLADDDATGLLVMDDNVAAIPKDNNANIHYPTLYRVLTEETISLNKPVFRLGKEKSYVDYFVTNNVAVSRSHADIITRNNGYFVKDLNSKNHTYINGREIPVLTETSISDGDMLRLGNEEFIFRM